MYLIIKMIELTYGLIGAHLIVSFVMLIYSIVEYVNKENENEDSRNIMFRDNTFIGVQIGAWTISLAVCSVLMWKWHGHASSKVSSKV